jgi:TP901 family phage tail tape measure protein
MAELVTTATIRLHDAITAPLRTLANGVVAQNQRLAQSSKQAGANMAAGAKGAATAVAGGAMGFGAIIEQAQEFNKHIFGVGAGQLVDEKDGSTKVEFAMEEMERMSKLSLDLGRNMKFSSTKIAEMGETFIKAGMKDGLEDMVKATVSLSKADTDTPAKAIADFMHTMTVLYKTDYEKGPGDFVRKQADMILTAADQTKLSVGSIMEGMRQFQSVGANLGLGTQQMLPMLMAGVQRGFGASEFGTMLKSDFGRLLKRTGPATSVLSRLGIDINSEEFSKGTSQFLEVTNAVRNLRNSVRQYGALSGKDSAVLGRLIEGGARDPNKSQASVVDAVTDYLAKKTGKTTDKDRTALRREVEASILSKTGDLNPLAVMQKMMEKGASQADFDTVFEGRHSARNAALRQSLAGGEKSELKQWEQLLGRMHGQGLDAVETLWSKSVFGNVEAMKASFQRLWIVLSNASVVQSVVNRIEQFVDALSKVDGKTANMAATLIAIGAAAGPAMLILRGLASPLGLLVTAGALAVGSLDNAQQSMIDFHSTFTPLMREVTAGPEWTELLRTLGDVKTSFAGIFGTDGMAAGAVAANLLVDALKNVVDGFNGAREFLEMIGLATPKAKKQTTYDEVGRPDYMKWSDQENGYVDSRSFVKKSVAGLKQMGDDAGGAFESAKAWARDKGLTFEQMFGGVKDELKLSADAGKEAQVSAATELTGAAAALSKAATSLQNLRIENGPKPAQAPSVTPGNGGSYGGK